MNDSCLNCNRFSQCTDRLKAHAYVCKRWVPFQSLQGNYVDRLFSGDLRTRSDLTDSLSDDSKPSRIQQGNSLVTRSYSAMSASIEDIDQNELDLTSYLDEVLRPDKTVLADLKIDDRDLKEAANFYEFCFNDAGPTTKPFARQLWMGLHLFHEFCYPCSANKKALDDIMEVPIEDPQGFVASIQLLEYGKCPKCGLTKLDLLNQKHLTYYNELAILLGQRSGKSTVTALFASYLTHRYLKLQRPTQVFGKGVAENTILTGTFVGLRYKDAVDLLWSPFHHLVNNTKWFEEYNYLLDYYGEKYGEELYKNMDTFLEYKHRNLFIYPSGPSKKTLRGRTRIFSGIDELDYFDFAEGSDTKERTSGKEVYNALDRSLLTIRALSRKQVKAGNYNVPTAYGFNLSSPASYFGFLTTLVRKNLHNSRSVLALNLPTWEVNPTITQKDLEKEFKDDPVKAWQDYGAVAPKSVNSFFTNTTAIIECFNSQRNNIQYESVVRNTSQETVKVSKIRTSQGFGMKEPSILALDAGYSNNCFAAMTAHLNPDKNSAKKVIVSAAVEVIPEPDKGIVVDFATVDEDMIWSLIEEKNVHVILADRWNSLSTLHRIRDKYPHITIVQYRMKYEDFITVRSYVDSTAVSFPRLEMSVEDAENSTFSDAYPVCFERKPLSHLYIQLLTVRDSVKSVLKGEKLTDDLFRCMCLCVTKLVDEEFMKKHMKNAMRKQGKSAAVVVGSRSSGTISNFTKATDQSARPNIGTTLISSDGRAILAKR